MSNARRSGYDWSQWVTTDINALNQYSAGGAAAITDVLTDSTSLISVQAATLFTEIEALRAGIEARYPNIGLAAEFYYTRDALGRISTQQETVLEAEIQHQYEYDAAGRLSAHVKNGNRTEWGYDINGNRTTENGQSIAIYDAEDRLITFKTSSYRRDSAGDGIRRLGQSHERHESRFPAVWVCRWPL